MPSTYSGNPGSTPKDAVRFLIQDVGPTSFDVTDEEIVWLLEQEGNYWLAAAVLCEKLTTIKSSGGLASKSVGGLSESYSQGSIAFYENQAKIYRMRGSGRQVPVAAAIPQIFGMGQFDHPEVIGPGLNTAFTSEEKED
jgi:hypothetical protein